MKTDVARPEDIYGPCVGPADRKLPCAECGSPPGESCRNNRALNQIADRVLAHKPKPKSKPAKKRARRAKKLQAADV
jgi:hypothetical protein